MCPEIFSEETPLCKRLFALRVVVYRRFDCFPFTGFVLFKDMLSYSFQGYIQSLDTFVLTLPSFCAISTMCVIHTAVSRKVVGKNVHATIPKGNMGYDQYTVPDTVAVEPTFVAFL